MKDEIKTLIKEALANLPYELVGANELDSYISKIIEKAELILWVRGTLEGVVAFYCNDVGNKHAYITMVAVHPKSRGKGIGRSLVVAALESMTARGFEKCGLRVHKENLEARTLYRSLGFKDIGDDGDYTSMERLIDAEMTNKSTHPAGR
jgi:ribosomal protein S18 acetylase RimI-like enzyme